jgi:hypothetical protein
MALRKSQKSLRRWTKQKWTTPSGKKSSETGEVYAPKKTTEKKEKLLGQVNNMLDMVFILEKN